MRNLWILGGTALGLLVLAQAGMGGRGGAARGGMRGAVVGNMVGGSEGAQKGAQIGVVTGATRAAIGRETQARTEYQTTEEYRNAKYSNFSEAPPDVLASTAGASATKPSGEAVILKDGTPMLGITFPADWKQKTIDNYVSAVSRDGHAYAMVGTLKGAADKKAGIKKIQAGLETYLQDIKYDDPTETKGGALLITGTGKGKAANCDVVFAAGIFEASKDQLAGAVFVVDSKLEDHYKETVKGICQTLRRAEDFAKK